MPQTENNGRIVRNTLFLYLRMLVTTIVGLYTSRVVLQTLGTSDYGIYSLVGGVVSIAGFLNIGMMQASQRFMSFSLGKGNPEEISETYSTSVFTHLLIATVVLALAESAGLYLVQQLNIAPDRMKIANFVYQCSILTFVVSVLSVPYNSAIIAHEKMDFYACISILEAVLKLAVLYLLVRSPFDKLLSYAVLMLTIQLLILTIYSIYCHRKFEECRHKLTFDKTKVSEMFKFAGWSIVGNFGFSFRDQGTNIILNFFFSTVVNAARGLATSVGTVMNSFASNITLAFNPPIVKSYASGDSKESSKLVYMSSRISFFLLTTITVPCIQHMDFLLKLWLGNVPDWTSTFLRFILCVSLIYSMSQPVTVAIQATGKIKKFQIWICCLMVSELTLTCIILALTHNLTLSLCPSILSNAAALFIRFHILKKMVERYKWKDYLHNVIIKCLGIFLISFGLIRAVNHFFTPCDTIVAVLIRIMAEILSIGAIVFLLGLEPDERKVIIRKMNSTI